MGAAVAMASLIDDEGLAEPVGVDLIGSEQVDNVDLTLLGTVENRSTSLPPSPGTRPRSRPATLAAAVCSTLNPFQPISSFTVPIAIAALAASASTAAPSARVSVPGR